MSCIRSVLVFICCRVTLHSISLPITIPSNSNHPKHHSSGPALLALNLSRRCQNSPVYIWTKNLICWILISAHKVLPRIVSVDELDTNRADENSYIHGIKDSNASLYVSWYLTLNLSAHQSGEALVLMCSDIVWRVSHHKLSNLRELLLRRRRRKMEEEEWGFCIQGDVHSMMMC